MKFVFVPILMILVLTQTFSQWLVVLEYKLNKDYIAKNLCINRARPKMHCNGKCQMMKKLAEEEKQNSHGNSNNTQIRMQELVCDHSLNQMVPPPPASAERIYNELRPAAEPNAPAFPPFHPPALS